MNQIKNTYLMFILRPPYYRPTKAQQQAHWEEQHFLILQGS